MKRARKSTPTNTPTGTEGVPEEGSDTKKPSTPLEVVICPVNDRTAIPDDIRALVPVTRVANVCRHPPRSRHDAQEWGRLWPVQFKPNEVDRIRDRGLSADDMKQIHSGRNELIKLTSIYGGDTSDDNSEKTSLPAGFIMNPANGSVLINSLQATERVNQSIFPSSSSSKSIQKLNPLYTTGMILIEGLSSLVRDQEALPLEKRRSLAAVVQEGLAAVVQEGPTALPVDQYLLTGLDVYIQHEPDLMTTMAFLHSRVRRIYYLQTNEYEGALGSKYILNDMKELNHRFRVFHVTTTTNMMTYS